jgi:hypothetical protein
MVLLCLATLTFSAVNAIYLEDMPEDKKLIHKMGKWNSIERQRAVLDKIAITLDIKKPEDWYNVTVPTVYNLGATFLPKYKNSLIRG